MYIPDSVRKAMGEAFYDKAITVLTSTVERDRFGGARKTVGAVKGTFKGNVRFNNLGELQNELGLTEDIDIAITCQPDTAVELDDILEYGGVRYLATSVIPSDSHLTIIGEKWEVL